MASRPVGRPRKISKRIQNDIINALQTGATYELACSYAGVSYAAFNNWMNRGRKELDRLRDERDKLHENVPLLLSWVNKTRPARRVIVYPYVENSDDQKWNIVKTMPKSTVKRLVPRKFPRDVIENLRPQPTEREFMEFFKAITAANAIAGVGWLGIIDRAANNDPNWAAWMLMKRFPAEYGNGARSTSVEVKTPAGGGDVGAQETVIKIVYQDYVPPVKFEEETQTTPHDPDS